MNLLKKKKNFLAFRAQKLPNTLSEKTIMSDKNFVQESLHL